MQAIASKLVKVMNEVKYIQKRGFNSFHNYRYAMEADVNEKIREELVKVNVLMIPNMLSHSVTETTTLKGATEYIVTVDMEFTFIDGDSGESITYKMSGSGQDRGDKGIFKAISGAQKYALMKAFMIPTGDDPEGDVSVDERNHDERPTAPQQRPEVQRPMQAEGMASDKQRRAIFSIGRGKGLSDVEVQKLVLDMTGHDRTTDLTSAEASKVIDHLSKMTKSA